MKNVKFLFFVYCLFTLGACNSSTENKPAPTPPVSAKEAIISVEKELNGLLPDCAVKIQETPKGIELKEYKAAFNCNTSDSKVPSYQLKTLETKIASLLSTLVVAKRSALDTNQINYVEAIESEANMIALSIRNSLVSSEKADRETGARITTLLKKWDCQMQNVPMEKWPTHILTASDSTCKKINLSSYASVYELKKDFLSDLELLGSSYLRPDSRPGTAIKQMMTDLETIFMSVQKNHVDAIDQNLPEYINSYYYPKTIVIDGVSLADAKLNPRMMDKINLVLEFFKVDKMKNSNDSEFYNALKNKIEEIHFVTDQIAPFELGFTVPTNSSCPLDKNGVMGMACSNYYDNDVTVTAKSSYPNNALGTLRISIKNENLAKINIQSALPEVAQLIKDGEALQKFANLRSAGLMLKYKIKAKAESKINFRVVNGSIGGSIDALQTCLNRVQKLTTDKLFSNVFPSKSTPPSYYLVFDLSISGLQLNLPIYNPTHSASLDIPIVINILDTEETIAAKLNPYLVPAE